MTQIIRWNQVSRENWSYRFEELKCGYIAYKLTKLPDFSEVRFSYLCKEEDERQAEVAKRQMNMLRQFHGLGENWAVSMRLARINDSLCLYLLFRYAGPDGLDTARYSEAQQLISNSLMRNEYSFEPVTDFSKEPVLLDAAWAGEMAEITKNESEYYSDTYPNGTRASFYVPFSWTASDNSMEGICNALMNHESDACVEITIVPAKYLQNEKEWMNINIQRLKESMNGETIRGEQGRIIWQGEKLPILKTPLDNCEKINKQYETSRVFLASIRVFAISQAATLANALLVNSVRNDAKIQVFRKGFGKFDYFLNCYKNTDISADFHTPWWVKNERTAPYRAQRLTRLNSVEEITNFFRLPIPIKPGFPGFDFDTGIAGSKKKAATDTLTVGTYLDTSSKSQSEAAFSLQQFAKHGLIVGVPGSGKTTAMFNILYQLWHRPEEEKIPFIILEPAKTEYRALKTLDSFKEDMLVFTLGDEGVSPFRFNPMEVLPGIRIESHISKLQACFVGAFDLFDPLPIFLEQAIRRTYEEKGWYEDSRGGDEGVETPTLSDLCRNAEYIVSHSGFDSKMKSDFQASLLERLNSLRRGSKGRMLDTKHSIPMEELMNRPIVLELDSLNGDEKSLMMMFLLSYVYEYCKVQRKSGSSLRHMLLVEEAHNLIPAGAGGNENRADPRAQTIELFVNMLAEMRALGQGILIADQLPTAIAPQAVKQTNVKVLMRVTAKDDREEIGNTMDLNEEQMHQVVNFKTGNAYLYHEGEDRVRAIRMVNFKGEHDVEEPPSDEELRTIMEPYQFSHKELYLPYEECSKVCSFCSRRTRSQAEIYLRDTLTKNGADPYKLLFEGNDDSYIDKMRKAIPLCAAEAVLAKREYERLEARYKNTDPTFLICAYIHLNNHLTNHSDVCRKICAKKTCTKEQKETNKSYFSKLMEEMKNVQTGRS